MPRPTRFTAHRIFGEYDLNLDFPERDEFAIIYGPNGVGKTQFLEIIRAACNLDTYELARKPFRSFEIEFEDNSRLSINRLVSDGNVEIDAPLFRPGRGTVEHSDYVNIGGTDTEKMQEAGFWRRTGPNSWFDRRDGEVLTNNQYTARYGRVTKPFPAEHAQLLSQIPTSLIRTQRILIEGDSEPNPYRSSSHLRKPTVGNYPEDLMSLIGESLAQNSRISQARDRSFPRRLLDAPKDGHISEEEIREGFNWQNERRMRLAELSLINSEPELPLPERELEPWQLTVLKTYLEDTAEKLATFDDIVRKVNLLEEIINRRFLRKELRVSADLGLTVRTANGEIIPVEELSSGEQHELVLIFELLFRTEEGSLVLIDEPEISLHVAWQRHFLEDIRRICKESSIRVIVATHSPQIIGPWWDRTTQMGPDFSEDAF